MGEFFLGWDVGGWNCDRNPKSRDAVCLLAGSGHKLRIIGEPWRGNLREKLVTLAGRELVDAVLDLCGVKPIAGNQITIAIDTPLAWPVHLIDLLTTGATAAVPCDPAHNPYLFRAREMALFDPGTGRGPLSVVRNMIGSQSTKGIHFRLKAGLIEKRPGVWEGHGVTAIETYPAAALRNHVVGDCTKSIFDKLRPSFRSRGKAWRQDVRDSIACAVVAVMYRRDRSRLLRPDGAGREGWIWLPAI